MKLLKTKLVWIPVLFVLWNIGCSQSLKEEKRVDVCSTSPCQNNATCIMSYGKVNCTCGQGFTGIHCDTRINCSSNPCQNNGTCQNETNGYACLCQKPYNGTNCEDVCENKRNDCFYYDNAKCVGIYASWGKQNCAHRCGYCQDKPKCIDTMADCDKLDIRDCVKPEYAGYMRTNCRKTCSLCALPDIYAHQIDGSNHVTPSALPINNQAPSRYGNECVDHLGDLCLDYNDDKCYGIYSPWATAHCAVRCGYCEGLEPLCIDRIDYCDAYSQSTCLEPIYARWARKTCRKFCGKCHVPTQVDIFTTKHLPPTPPTTVTTSSTTPATTQTTFPTIGPHCVDKIQNCIDYVDEACMGIFQYWAMVNCPRRCGYCTDTHSCMDYIKGCSHLPDVCKSPEYADFARTNCRRFCKFCNATTHTNVSQAVTIPNHQPTPIIGITVEPRPIIDGHMGKQFWLAFPQTYTYGASVKLHLFATTDASNVPMLHINASGSTSTFLRDKTHPSKSMTYTHNQRPNTVEKKGVLVTSNVSIALYTLSWYSTTHSDISWVPPINKLGTTYIAASYHPRSYYSFISIVATQPDTTVNVLLNTTGTVTYNGITYRDGDNILLYLTQYLSFQVSSGADITGSKITSNRPIAVQSGVSYFWAPHTGGSYSAASVYLPPVNKWGKIFVVPPILSAKQYVIRIVPSDTSTSLSITITSETGTINHHNANATIELNYTASKTYVIECNKPCFVVQIPASESGYNVTSYMVTVPAVEQFSRDYNIMVGNIMSYNRHYMSLMIRSEEVYGLLMNGITIFSYELDVKAIKTKGSTWSVLSLQLPVGYHHISHISPYSVYGLISYGFGHSKSYGYVAGLNI